MKVPKYYRIKQKILRLIADAEPGMPVPPERELAQQFDTSRTTVRQAIAELVVDGRLARRQGSGTFVARPKLMSVRPLTSFSQDLDSDGWRPGSVVLDIREESADGDVCAHLAVPPGTPVQRVERLRTAADETIAHEVAYLPAVFPGLADLLEGGGSLYRALREHYGIHLAGAEDTVETVLADPEQASLLGVETGLPMLLVHRTGWDESGRRVEWTSSAFRGDRFRFISHQRLGDAGEVRQDAPQGV